MKIYFRELLREDISAIKEISKEIWEGEDYIPTVIEKWLEEKDCYNYGGFSDEKKKDLIGFGRVKFYDEIAWLEGGRVKKPLQRKGVGRQLMGHAIEYAKKFGARFAQYDTSSENKGSLALAEFFGFKEKDRMHFLEIIPENKNIEFSYANYNINYRKIGPQEALSAYRKLDDGPKDELNNGWSYIPLNEKYLQNKDFNWYKSPNAIILFEEKVWKIIEKEDIEELKLVVYGNEKEASQLIKYVISVYPDTKTFDQISLYCRSNVIESAKKLGFHNPEYQEEPSPEQVILFQKIL
ncbi:MAG: GNAT family N-acetyltransferase [Promethearchaeota archaeon]|nr:MAG: GNAT family N-acetyltransferase [Candidatus Lokiarchaeota archaeon]